MGGGGGGGVHYGPRCCRSLGRVAMQRGVSGGTALKKGIASVLMLLSALPHFKGKFL